MRHRDERQYLQDILNCIERIEAYVSDKRSFASDSLVQDAVMRNLEIMGEAATHLSEETTDALPEVAWRDAIDMRNFLIHGYLIVDLDVVWRTVELDLPNRSHRIGRRSVALERSRSVTPSVTMLMRAGTLMTNTSKLDRPNPAVVPPVASCLP